MALLDQFADEFARLSAQLEQALTGLKDQVREYAEAEHAYRKAKAAAWLTSPKGTVPEREAWVNGETAEQRRRRDLADGLRQGALEAVRSRRQQISALQSRFAAHREEAGIARYGPEAA